MQGGAYGCIYACRGGLKVWRWGSMELLEGPDLGAGFRSGFGRF